MALNLQLMMLGAYLVQLHWCWFLPILEDLTPLAGSETLTVDFPLQQVASIPSTHKPES